MPDVNKWKAVRNQPLNTIEKIDRNRRMMLALPVEKNKGKHIPWGYKISESDPKVIEADERLFKILLLAKNYIKEYSIRSIAEWISKESGNPITYEGFRRLIIDRCPDDRCLLPMEEREKI